MNTPIPQKMKTSDLTGASKLLAERLEPRLQAGVEKFQQLQDDVARVEQWGKIIQVGKYLAAAFAPLIICGFGFAVWALSLAKKTDVTDFSTAEAARHAALELRTSVLETQRASDSQTTNKALDAINAHLAHIDDVQLDIRIRLGAIPASEKQGSTHKK